MIDAHFHMQDPNATLLRKNVKEGFEKLSAQFKKYNVTQINAIYWPNDVNIWHNNNCNELGDEMKLKALYENKIVLKTGIQLNTNSDLWTKYDSDKLKYEPKIDFIKVHDNIEDKRLNQFIEHFINLGINKFQFHTGILFNETIDK